MQHRLDLVDVNYVYMPRKSSAFQEYLDSMSLRNSSGSSALPLSVNEFSDSSAVFS